MLAPAVAELWIDDGCVIVRVAVEVRDFAPQRIDIEAAPDPIVRWDVEANEGDPDAVEPAQEPATGCFFVDSVVEGPDVESVRDAIRIALEYLEELAASAIIQLVDCIADDEHFASRLKAAVALHDHDQVSARTQIDELAGEAFARGDVWTAVLLRVTAVEMLNTQGRAAEALRRVEELWAELTNPLLCRELTQTYAISLCLTGSSDRAHQLYHDFLEAVTDDADRTLAIGNRGLLRTALGRYAEAIDDLRVALDSEQLNDETRALFEEGLAQARPSRNARTEWNDPGPTATADELLNAIALSSTPPSDAMAMIAQIRRTQRLSQRMREMWDRLGPGQRTRLLTAEAGLASLTGEDTKARMLIAEARAIVEENGDAYYVSGLDAQAAYLGEDVMLSTALGPFERANTIANRVLHRIKTAALRAAPDPEDANKILAGLDEALQLIDAERFRHRTIDDRRRWSELALHLYGRGLIASELWNRPDVFADILERTRAQGLPDLTDRGLEVPFESGSSAAFAAQQDSGDLAVEQPPLALVNPDPSSTGISLQQFVHEVGGRDAWYLIQYEAAGMLFWLVREPSGELHTGMTMLNDHVMSTLAALTDAPTGQGSGHPLIDLTSEELDATLEPLTNKLVPHVLRDSLEKAVRSGNPLRLVWSPTPDFASVPLGLLPIAGPARLIDAAVVTYAPPTAIVAAHLQRPPVAGPDSLPITVAVTITGLEAELVGPGGLAVSPQSVTGLLDHVYEGYASTLATPASVLRQWRSNPFSVGLYYGHIVEATVGPLDGGVEIGEELLTVGSMLRDAPHGAPARMVIAGCSSMSSSSVGSGEWWGLPTALLWQGSRQVIASLRNLVHCAVTARFVAELCDLVRVEPDVAAALRSVQLAWLHRWAGSSVAAITTRGDFAPPLIWSTFGVVGVGDRVAL